MSIKAFLVEISDWHQVVADAPEDATQQEVLEIIFPLALEKHRAILVSKPSLEILSKTEEDTVGWATIFKQNERAIKGKIKEAYALACDGDLNTEYVVTIDKQGCLTVKQLAQTPEQLSVEADAPLKLEIVRFQGFDPTEGDDMTDFPEDIVGLSDREKINFVLWCQQNSKTRHHSYLGEWNPKVNQRWRKDYKENYLAAYADNVAENVFKTNMRRVMSIREES